MQADLLIQNARVVDPSQAIDRVMNVAITDGKIAALDAPAATEAKQTYDASGKLVCPGFIDIHAHVSSDIVPLAVTPDEAGVTAGCTAVSDAGSVGYLHLHPFRKFAIAPARTDVFVFLNVSPFGEVVLPEVGFDIVNEAEFLKVIEANRDIVKGIKLRAIGELIYATKVDVVDLAVRIARKAGLPLMIHLGMGFNEPLTDDEIASFITRMLGRCEKGDILTHAFTDKPGGVFRLDGTPIAGLEDALARGVYLDAAPGRGHINFNLVKAALARGFAPQALGTDVVRLPEEQPHFYNVAAVASKFMALGMSLNDVIAAATCNPAKMLGEEEKRGGLKIGMTADLSILGYHEGEFLLHDGRVGNVVPANIFLSPQMVVKRGEIIQVRESHRGHIPTKSTMEALMKK
ncbi:MAG: amidohydrolase family protein [Chloroflexi bacterium]|nr:amidohydrolase family protein [Chloroflexota bacterium]